MKNKLLGKIKNFDGYSGMIITQDDVYLFSVNNALTPIKNDDLVAFYGDTVLFDQKATKVARKIEAYNPKELKRLSR